MGDQQTFNMADVPALDEEEPKQEESTASVPSETDETSQEETPNGVKTDGEESKAPKENQDGKEKSSLNRRGNRYHPYKEKHSSGEREKKTAHRNRVFISNIPYDMKWQAIKDLMREKVGEVTYVELFKDAEGKSRGCGVVEFKDEEFVKKAILSMNKHDLNGRPLNIKEDPDGEHARRVLQRMGGQQGSRGQDMGPGGMNVPPSIANNPNIPPEVIHGLQAGRLGTTVFVANLDFKVGWKKLKEVFCMAGVVKRADVKEDKDGKSRGMGTVTFEQSLEAVQAISMFNGQMLFDRQMHVKMDEKSLPPEDFCQVEKSPQLPRGLGGIGMGLGPGGQPINSTRISGGGGMGSMGPGGMDTSGYGGMNRIGGDMYRSGMGGMDRDFSHSDMPVNRGFGDSFGGMGGGFGGGMGSGGMGHMGTGLGGGMGNMPADRMGSGFDRMGMSGMDMNRGFGGYGGGGPSHMGGGGMSDRGSGSKAGCQIFVRNLSYDLTWQKLKEKFSHCGQVMFAEIKMEGGKSKGCGTVRFDSAESADKACRMMNGTKINGREVDVRIDRNA
ncbi:myelin expression factor 2 isoform X2 [Hippoglossus hippoglossus]|uniref:myelin expression factor 2 isoform X2 n=1 Tax=Hippoglossus hippoglossus TaxID=8267 RepID=UPI00148E4FB7|nr:myelin expression factor 2 isoform X2 [Hippoglossus hippoglossus]XP_035020762.1 myelin expression factor 2 isoform X2 [Hippoglossus stenolepis]